MSRDARRQRWATLLIVPAAFLAAAALRAGQPSVSDRETATSIHRQALDLLRDGARAAAEGHAPAFAVALREAAGRIDALLAAAPWLVDADRRTLQGTAAALRTRSDAGPQGYSPDVDLAVARSRR